MADAYRPELAKALDRGVEAVRELEALESEYHSVRRRLRTLPDRVRHPVMVPVGPKAFFPGHLVHTNELLVLLGAEYFAEKSAKEAVGVVDRRLRLLAQRKEAQEKSNDGLRARLDVTNKLDTREAEETFEIREPLPEDMPLRNVRPAAAGASSAGPAAGRATTRGPGPSPLRHRQTSPESGAARAASAAGTSSEPQRAYYTPAELDARLAELEREEEEMGSGASDEEEEEEEEEEQDEGEEGAGDGDMMGGYSSRRIIPVSFSMSEADAAQALASAGAPAGLLQRKPPASGAADAAAMTPGDLLRMSFRQQRAAAAPVAATIVERTPRSSHHEPPGNSSAQAALELGLERRQLEGSLADHLQKRPAAAAPTADEAAARSGGVVQPKKMSLFMARHMGLE